MRDATVKNILFIAGPPFSGKSAAGRILSGRLRIPFKDLDGEIETRAGMSVCGIFASIGEVGFRKIESQCLAEVAGLPGPLVVALGGGTLLLPENLGTVIGRGVLATLAPCMTELLARAAACRDRPLASDRAALMSLLESRREHYDELPGRLDTTGMNPDEVAEALEERFGPILQPR